MTESTEALIRRIDRVKVLHQLPSGEIRLEQGADGLYLLFDCDCLDALPYCQAQCCGLNGIVIDDEEVEDYKEQGIPIEWHGVMGEYEMQRSAEGFCNQLDRDTRLCKIHDRKPNTCSIFHCTRGALQRGWKLPNEVNRIRTR